MSVGALLGAIAFDPNIRGILVVLTGATVLMGSVYMVLATNSGARLGIMLTAAALFGFGTILGLLWTINTGGLKGRDAAWMPAEINYNRLAPGGAKVPVATAQLESLAPPEDLADPEELLARYPLIRAMALGSEGKDYVPATLTKLKTLVSPMVSVSTRDAAVTARKALDQAPDVVNEDAAVAALLAAQDESLRDQVHDDARALRADIDSPFGDWCLISESDPRRGNAVSSADAELAKEKVFGETTSASDYIVGDVWFLGGREPCSTLEERSQASRVWDRVKTVFMPKQPELLSAVTLVRAKPVVVAPGEAPPSPSPLTGATTMTVVQRWNYGNVRLIPFVFFLINLSMFCLFAWLLHTRDKLAMEQRAAWKGGAA